MENIYSVQQITSKFSQLFMNNREQNSDLKQLFVWLHVSKTNITYTSHLCSQRDTVCV